MAGFSWITTISNFKKQKMKRINLYILIFLIMNFISCSKMNHVYVYSPDKKQCITIITINHERYVIDGKHESIPHKDYVKIDLRDVDRISDAIAGCWKNEDYDWILINDNTKIVENRLDTLKYKFLTNFPVDESNIPTLKNFTDGNCYNFDFEVFSIVPENGAIVEFE